MLAYSPRKKRAKGIDEYSVWKPWTSSASDIGRSNGVRLVSASADTKKITNIGNSGSQNQFQNQPDWATTTWVRLSEPAHSKTVISTKPIETSYDTICAAERRAPRKAYFELDAQPAMITPYTPSDEMAKR